MASSASRKRIACTACALPFYAGKEQCPYCGTDSPEAGSAADEDGEFRFDSTDVTTRPRTTCPACGLPHYEEADGCPYCELAGDTPSGEQDAGEEPPESVEPAAADRPAADEGGGLFGRLKRALGL